MKPTTTALLNRLLARGKFRHIQILLHLAELGSVQRTADTVGLTQSSVTQTLAYLEALLDVRLFERHARGVRPTPACRDLLPVARQLLLGLAEGAEAVAARRRLGEGTVRVASSAGAIHGLLIASLPAFADRFPAIQVLLREAEGEDQLLAIARDEVDLVVCRRPPAMPEGWEFHPVREDRMVIVCRAGHPLARAGTAPDDTALALARWLLLPAGVAARTRFDRMAERFDAPPATHPIVTRSLPLLWTLLRGPDDLLALLPLNLVRPMLDTGELVTLQTAGQDALDPIGLLQPRENLAAAAQRLSDFLRQPPPAP